MKVGGILGGGIGQGAGVGPQDFVNSDQADNTPNVTEEEQSTYNTFVQNGMEVLYNKEGKVEPEVLKRLSTGKKPIDTLAQTGVWLVMMLEQNAKQSGRDIPDDVLMHGGRELFEQLADIDDAAGIHTFKQAELQGAWYNALDMYREANSAEGDRFKPTEASAAFEALNEADKEGRADEVVPGFYQQSEKAISVAQQDQAPTQQEDLAGGDTKILNRGRTGQVSG